jgi:hypothetical protein
MNMEEEEYSPFGGFGSGCDLHGEDFLRECTMCGIEFCSACFPQSALCADCAAQGEFDDEEEEEPAAEDKDLLLLDGFDDDETELDADAPLPPLAPVVNPAGRTPAKPARPKSARTPKAKPAPQPKAKTAKSKTQPPKAKPKPKAKAKPAKAKPKAKAPNARPAPKKRKK